LQLWRDIGSELFEYLIDVVKPELLEFLRGGDPSAIPA
jgi:hypothetical protein